MKKKILITISCVLIAFLGEVEGGIKARENAPRPSFSIEIIPWSTVNEMIPNKTYFTIIDVETGLQFDVQRRAGSKHADVQPVTEKDTEIMKKIFGGKWSWDRRAILVKFNDQLISASMNGMPHGAGALDNGFPGHFCVHFYGSTTHKTPIPDLAHKIMILKAGGELHRYLYGMDPYELVKVMEVAINQREEKLLSQVMISRKGLSKKILKEMDHVEITYRSLLPSEDIYAYFGIEVKAKMTWVHDHQVKRNDVVLFIRRDTPEDQWKIDGHALLHSLDKQN